MTSDRDPESVLKMRLAAGEIDVEKYRELLGILRDRQSAEGSTHASPSSSLNGKMLVQADNILLYENSIVVEGQTLPIAEIVSVSGMSSSQSVNFIPMDKRSYVGFTLASGKHVSLSEDRTLFAPARHKAIRALHATLKQLTFQSRLNRIATLLRQQGQIEIYSPFSGEGEAIHLTSRGMLMTKTRTIDLKQAKKDGVFGVGVESRSLGYSRSYDTEEVVVAEGKGTLGFIPRSSLRFKANRYDTDIVNALLQWIAVPGNSFE